MCIAVFFKVHDSSLLELVECSLDALHHEGGADVGGLAKLIHMRCHLQLSSE